MTQRVAFTRRIARRDASLRLYAILDAESCVRRGLDLFAVAETWGESGVQLIQYRDKPADQTTYLQNARKLRALVGPDVFLMLNDHAHLVEAAGAYGVHVGQSDLAPAEARRLIGPDRILGVSTHSADQALAAHSTEADYLAIGPVFATNTKADAEPAVGLYGVQAARAVTNKPLVAIGGIGLGDARAVEMAGADAVAVISALLPSGSYADVTQRARDFIARLK